MVKLVCNPSCEKKQEVKPYELAVEQSGNDICGYLVDPDTGIRVCSGFVFTISSTGMILNRSIGCELIAKEQRRIPFARDHELRIQV
jgi:hypothetical protein